jgi:drug/metabolite transporter (DMT)-like permease
VQLLLNPTSRLFIGAALISLSPVWVKLVDVSATTSGFYRVAIGGVALTLYLLLSKQRVRFSRKIWFVLLAGAVFFALDLWFWHRSIQYIGPGLATLLANFQVFIMTAFGVIVLREAPRLMQLMAIPLAFVGLTLIVGLDWVALPRDYRLGVIYGLATAVVYASYLLSLRRARKDAQQRIPSREIAVISLVSAVILGLSALVEGESLAVSTIDDALWLGAYGLLSHSVGTMFIASSLPHVSTTQAGVALLLQPTLSFVWDVLFFARPLTPKELLGAMVALIAIYLGSRNSSEQMQRARQE